MHGVYILNSARQNTIGTTGAGNTIAFNGGDGVYIHPQNDNRSNAILANSIHSNSGLGIDLGTDGVTTNDAGDADLGPNDLQNFPTLTSAQSNGTTTLVEGLLDSAPDTLYRLDFYSSPACDPSGYGEGETFLASADVTTGGNGLVTLALSLPLSVTPGLVLTATATDPDNNTSEFSNCTNVQQATADLSVAKDDGQTTAVPGRSISYAITLTNHGPNVVPAVTLIDTVPSSLQNPLFTPSMGSFDPSTGAWTGLDLAAGASVVLTLEATVDPGATGALTNVVSVAPPPGILDPVPGNNSSSDTDTLAPEADLSIAKDDGRSFAIPGSLIIYQITVSNIGPSDVTGGAVEDVFPSELTSCSWTCSPETEASCTTGQIQGDLLDTVDLPAGSGVTYFATCTIAPSADGILSNTATVSVPVGIVDPESANNIAVDSEPIDHPIFIDGFESSDISAWSFSSPGTLVLSPVSHPDGIDSLLQLQPNALRRVTEELEILAGFTLEGDRLFTLTVRRTHGILELRAAARTDGDRWLATAWLPIPEEAVVGLEWRRGLPGTLAGAFLVEVDGSLDHSVLELDNQRQRLAAVGLLRRSRQPVLRKLTDF